MPSAFELQTIKIHGHELGYRMGGSGPVLVLVHGMAGSSKTWRLVMPALTEHFTVIAPDLIGHGASAKPRADYSLGSFASGIRDLLVALGIERATIVGQSLGGGIAMQFAYQFPERCERLVLVASGGLGDEVNMLLRVLTMPGVEYVLPIACNGYARAAGTNVLGWLRNVGLRPSEHMQEIWYSYGSLTDGATRTAFVQTLRSVVDRAGQRVSATDKLSVASGVPTLIMWGDRDRIIPVQQAYAAHETVVGSRLEIFDGAGHYPHCDQPERFVDILVDFMTTTEGRLAASSR